MEHADAGVRVGTFWLKIVVLFHCLIVEVFAVNHKKHLVDFGHTRCYLRRLKRCECFAAACGVPNKTARVACAFLTEIDGAANAQKYVFGGGYLVGTHHHKVFVNGKYAKARQDVEDGAFGKKRAGKVGKVGNDVVLFVCPI